MEHSLFSDVTAIVFANNESLRHFDDLDDLFVVDLKALNIVTQASSKAAQIVQEILSRFASVVLLRGTLSRPHRKGKKQNTLLYFLTVFTADMVLKKGRPNGLKIKFDFYRFYRGYGRRKRPPPR